MNQEFFNECFTYLPKTGHLKWKKRPLHHFKSTSARKAFNSYRVGKTVAGKQAVVDGEFYSTAAIVWLIHNGGDYPKTVYHLNGNRLDDRIENLTVNKPVVGKPFVKKEKDALQSNNILGDVLLALKRVVDSQSIIYRRSWIYGEYKHLLPYCIKQQSNGAFIVLDRYYKPFGFDYDLDRKPWIDYDDNPAFDRYCIELSQLDLEGVDVKKGFVHFYNDTTAPRLNVVSVRLYIERVAKIFKLSAIL